MIGVVQGKRDKTCRNQTCEVPKDRMDTELMEWKRKEVEVLYESSELCMRGKQVRAEQLGQRGKDTVSSCSGGAENITAEPTQRNKMIIHPMHRK